MSLSIVPYRRNETPPANSAIVLATTPHIPPVQIDPNAPIPVSAEEISTRSYEQKYLIEDKITTSLIDLVNQGIRDQVSHGLFQYECHVPSFIYGFPKFDVKYVGLRLRQMYDGQGFQVSGQGSHIKIVWKRKASPHDAADAIRPTEESDFTILPPPPPKKPQKSRRMPILKQTTR